MPRDDDVGPEPAAEPERTDTPSPHSTALALLMLRGLEGYNVPTMVNKLNDAPARPLDDDPDWKVNHGKITAWEQGLRLRLAEAGRYGNWWGIPAPFLMVFASLSSDLRDGRTELAAVLADELIAAANLVRTLCDTPRDDLFNDKEHVARVQKVRRRTRQKLSDKDELCLHILSRLLAGYSEQSRAAFRKYAKDRWGKPDPVDPQPVLPFSPLPPPPAKPIQKRQPRTPSGIPKASQRK